MNFVKKSFSVIFNLRNTACVKFCAKNLLLLDFAARCDDLSTNLVLKNCFKEILRFQFLIRNLLFCH